MACNLIGIWRHIWIKFVSDLPRCLRFPNISKHVMRSHKILNNLVKETLSLAHYCTQVTHPPNQAYSESHPQSYLQEWDCKVASLARNKYIHREPFFLVPLWTKIIAILMNNYIVRSYRDVIVITKFAITKYAIRRASKAKSIVLY